jgi:ABC-type multidrug transport system ATPase subunit
MNFKNLNILVALIRNIVREESLDIQLLKYLRDVKYFDQLSLLEKNALTPLASLCQRAGEKLHYSDRNLIFLRLVEFIHGNYQLKNYSEEIETVRQYFRIDYVKNYLDIFNQNIAHNDFYKYRTIEIIPMRQDSTDGLWVDENKPKTLQATYFLEAEGIQAPIFIIYLRHLNVFMVKTYSTQEVYFNKHLLRADFFELFGPTDLLHLNKHKTLDFLNLKKIHQEQNKLPGLILEANNIAFSRRKKIKLHPLDIKAHEGELIAIHGYDSSGKTAIINILAGLSAPTQGKVSLNGYHYDTNWHLLKRVIGFVPDKDLLFDELSVYQNLYHYCKLFLGKLTRVEIEIKIADLLKKLQLEDIQHRIVGPVQKNRINPGKRKLVNIALELLKDPSVILIDDIITDLNDAETQLILDILQAECLAGKIVITSINHTFQHTLLNFDRLYLLDYSGYLIFEGAPTQLPDFLHNIYLDNLRQIANSDQHQHLSVLNLVNTPKYDQAGFLAESRAIPPEILHRKMDHQKKTNGQSKVKEVLPLHSTRIPKLEVQLWHFFIRNFAVKAASGINILIALLMALFLAFTTGILIKDPFDEINYSDNQNILHYYFIMFIMSFGVGLFMSALEIYRERYIAARETLLGLNWFSYINAKIVLLVIMVGVLLLPYIVLTQKMIQHPPSTVFLWVLSLTMAINGLLIGLIVSSLAMNQFRLNIAIIILFMLQLLFGGGMTLNKSYVYNHSTVQHITNLTPIRWAIEAMVVRTVTDNEYDKQTFPLQYKQQACTFYLETGIPYLAAKFDQEPKAKEVQEIIAREFQLMNQQFNLFPFEYQDSIMLGSHNPEVISSLQNYMTYLYFFLTRLKESLQQELENILSNEQMAYLERNHNSLLFTVATLEPEMDMEIQERFELKNTGIFHIPHQMARAPVFSANKLIGKQNLDTYHFNLIILWLMNTLLYLFLVANPLRFYKKWDT